MDLTYINRSCRSPVGTNQPDGPSPTMQEGDLPSHAILSYNYYNEIMGGGGGNSSQSSMVKDDEDSQQYQVILYTVGRSCIGRKRIMKKRKQEEKKRLSAVADIGAGLR